MERTTRYGNILGREVANAGDLEFLQHHENSLAARPRFHRSRYGSCAVGGDCQRDHGAAVLSERGRRSEERRVGKEWRSWGSPDHQKKRKGGNRRGGSSRQNRCWAPETELQHFSI